MSKTPRSTQIFPNLSSQTKEYSNIKCTKLDSWNEWDVSFPQNSHRLAKLKSGTQLFGKMKPPVVNLENRSFAFFPVSFKSWYQISQLHTTAWSRLEAYKDKCRAFFQAWITQAWNLTYCTASPTCFQITIPFHLFIVLCLAVYICLY